jgi:hypothetical protein
MQCNAFSNASHCISYTVKFRDFHTFSHEATNWKPVADISWEAHVQVEATCVKIQGRKSLTVATRMSEHSMVHPLKTTVCELHQSEEEVHLKFLNVRGRVKNYPQCSYILCSWLHCWLGMMWYMWSTCLLLLWCRCDLGSRFMSWKNWPTGFTFIWLSVCAGVTKFKQKNGSLSRMGKSPDCCET